MLFHGGYTINEALAGCVIGGVPAVLLPFLLRRQPIVVAILDPFMVGGYGAPKLAFAPLFILWFGIGIIQRSRWSPRWCSSLFISRRCRASERWSPSLCRWRRWMGANERQVGRHIVFPGAVPAIFAGFRIAVPTRSAAR